MEKLHRKYVFAPADKAANNVVIIWKRHYVEVLKGELNSTSTYVPAQLTKDQLLVHHINTLTKIDVKIDKCELPTFYWLPKLHKRPYKSRFISNSSHCSTTKSALFKPPQRRQGPDLRPLWLLVRTPSAIGPELAFSRAEHSLPYSDVTIYIFAISYLSSMLYVYRFLWPLRLGWMLVWCLYKEVYLQIFKCVSFWLRGCCGEWEGWARKPG